MLFPLPGRREDSEEVDADCRVFALLGSGSGWRDPLKLAPDGLTQCLLGGLLWVPEDRL